jgi:DNA end-binding protein Ku
MPNTDGKARPTKKQNRPTCGRTVEAVAMARPIWKGHITFGLVNIPVMLYSAEKRSDLHFKLMDSRNNAAVRYERVNEVTGEEVPWEKIVKAFEYDSGNYVFLEKEELERVAVEGSKAVEIDEFIDAGAIDYTYFDKPYFLVPGTKGDKGYVLLREALKSAGRIGIAKVVIRTRQYLAAVIPEGDALLLDLLRYPQEIRRPEEFDLPRGKLSDYKITEKEVDMAERLVDSMAAEWTPEQYHDEYRDALLEYISKKAEAEGEVVPLLPEEPPRETAEIIDIMDLLKQSVKRREQETKRKTPAKAKTSSRRSKASGGK